MKETLYTVVLGMLFQKKALTLLLPILAAVHCSAQQLISIPQGNSVKEIMVLPPSYLLDTTFKQVASVKSDPVKNNSDDADFDPQLERLAARAAAEGGNVLQLTRIENHKQAGHYKFWGEAYHTDKFAEMKAKIGTKARERTSQQFAYVTIYRPAYSKGFSDDSIRYDVYINDTLILYMQGRTRYVLKVAKEGPVQITVKHKDFVQNIKVDVKFGKDYFVRTYANFPGAGKSIGNGDMKVRVKGYTPYVERIEDEMEGRVESSMITERVVNKKI